MPNLPRHVRRLSFGPVVRNLKFTCGNNNRGGGKLRRAARSQISFLEFSERNLLIRPLREWQVKIYCVTYCLSHVTAVEINVGMSFKKCHGSLLPQVRGFSRKQNKSRSIKRSINFEIVDPAASTGGRLVTLQVRKQCCQVLVGS